VKYYELRLDVDQADGLVVTVLKDSLDMTLKHIDKSLADPEDLELAEALKTVINYFSVPEKHV